MGRYIDGQDRTQSVLFPERLDDWIEEDNPVRAVDVFVDALDLSAAGLRAGPACGDGAAGVSPGHAAEDLHLRVSEPDAVQPAAGAGGAAQRRADLADRPADARLQDHRRLPQGQRRGDPHASAASSCCCAGGLGLFEEATVAIDGSKFKAVNNRDKNFTERKLQARMQQLEESIARYLTELDRADRDPSLVTEARVDAPEGQARPRQGTGAARCGRSQQQLDEAAPTSRSR